MVLGHFPGAVRQDDVADAAHGAPGDLTVMVGEALKRLHDLPYLQTHPLAGFLPREVTARPAGAGRALQRALLDALDVLRAAGPAPGAAGRTQALLALRYLEGLSPPAVWCRLGISRSEYYRDHARGVQAVASLLRERLGLTGAAPSPAASGLDAAGARVHPARGGPPLATNLPLQPTGLVGRERELAELRHLLGTTRLLTLTGAGGCGKTRLALGLAAESVDELPAGVWLVEIAPLADPELVPAAAAVGVGEASGRPIRETLLAALRVRRLLLVLDNCEHLVEACAELAAALLGACPGVQVLATSREPLRTAGEVTWPVPPLATPPPDQEPVPERLVGYGAVRLFLDRAGAALPGFALTEQNAAAVARICLRLEGMPLALELAAARARVLPVAQIAERLDDAQRLLTGGSRTAPTRQQTLRAAFDWSHDLLSGPERVLFRRLSVFAGGWTPEAAEAVCAGAGPEAAALGAEDVLGLLVELVEKSLVVAQEQPGGARYRLLEPVRQYAAERLAAAGEERAVRRGHRDWCLAFAELAGAALHGPEQPAWMDRLEAEHDNMRAALGWSQADPDGAEPALRLSAALTEFWQQSGRAQEGLRWLDRALDRAAGAPALLRARALLEAGNMASQLGDTERARVDHREALGLYRERRDRAGVARALMGLGWDAFGRADYAGARRDLEESLALARELADGRLAAFALSALGATAREQGDYGHARACLEESLAFFRASGDTSRIAALLGQLGEPARLQGEDALARPLQEEALGLFRAVRDRPGIGWVLASLGEMTARQGDRAAARALLDESIAVQRETGQTMGLAWSLRFRGSLARAEGDLALARAAYAESLRLSRARADRQDLIDLLDALAGLAATEGDTLRAARLFGAAEAGRELIGRAVPPVDRATRSRDVEAARSGATEVAFRAAWDTGRATTLEQAVADAVAEEVPDR